MKMNMFFLACMLAHFGYSSLMFDSRATAGIDALSAYSQKMELGLKQNGNYGRGSECAIPIPSVDNFSLFCSLTKGEKGYNASAIGSGKLLGMVFTVSEDGTRASRYDMVEIAKAFNCAGWHVKREDCDAEHFPVKLPEGVQ